MIEKKITVMLCCFLVLASNAMANDISAAEANEILKKSDAILLPDECTYDLAIDCYMEDEDINVQFQLQAYKRGYTGLTVVWVSPQVERGDVGLRSREKIYYQTVESFRPTIMSYRATFFDSAQSWGDITSIGLYGDYKVKSATEVVEGGVPCYSLILDPNTKEVYARVDVLVERDTLRTLKRIYYTPGGKIIKTNTYSDYTYVNKALTGFKIFIDNIQYGINGTSVFSNITAKKLPNFLFDPSSIGRINVR